MIRRNDDEAKEEKSRRISRKPKKDQQRARSVSFSDEEEWRRNSRKPEKSVSFSEFAQIRVVAKWTIDEQAALFYTRQEISFTQHIHRVTISNIRATGMTLYEFARQNVSSSEVFMGLETQIDKAAAFQVYSRRMRLFHLVLEEQRRQRLNGRSVINQAELAKVAAMGSEWARKRARILGVLHVDENEIC